MKADMSLMLGTITTEADKGHELSLPSCRFQVVASELSLPSCRFQVVASELSLPSCRFYSWRDIILLQCERGGWGCQEKFKNVKEVCYTLLFC